jgi:hypothetical protein
MTRSIAAASGNPAARLAEMPGMADSSSGCILATSRATQSASSVPSVKACGSVSG